MKSKETSLLLFSNIEYIFTIIINEHTIMKNKTVDDNTHTHTGTPFSTKLSSLWLKNAQRNIQAHPKCER